MSNVNYQGDQPSTTKRSSLSDQAPVPPQKMPASTTGEPSKKAAKPPKPRKVEKRQRGRKG